MEGGSARARRGGRASERSKNLYNQRRVDLYKPASGSSSATTAAAASDYSRERASWNFIFSPTRAFLFSCGTRARDIRGNYVSFLRIFCPLFSLRRAFFTL